MDDHRTVLWGMERLIESGKPRMEVAGTATTSGETETKLLELRPDVVLLDLHLAGENGLDLLPCIVSKSSARVLILTGERDQELLDLAMLRGARGIVRKDGPAEEVLKAIETAHRGDLWLEQQALGRLFSQVMETRSAPMEEYSRLTARERKIVACSVEGTESNAALARRLCIAEATLRNHLTSIYHKLGIANRLELYAYVLQHPLAEEKTKSRS
ncbi:response regulator [Variovorax sp. HW608]|uniref:response regulator n=1 Tax=Variovorax sp. HW608 TaxID=1034889 RepID=UPI001E422C7F|nr:response regulator transcription factor [Variovorax sp. HW608]